MTDTTTAEGYGRIEWADVRAGDVLMHKNGDRLTVSVVDHVGYQTCKAAGAWRFVSSMTDAGFFPYRKIEPVPTTPGAYRDKDGEVWLLRDDEGGIFATPWFSDRIEIWASHTHAAHYAPFTRLVPMPTEEDVLAAIEAPEMLDHRTLAEDRAAAVMALLAGEEGGDDA